MNNNIKDLHSLSHTKWCCKYHVVFAPKCRRKAFYDARKIEIGQILRQLCEWKGVNIIEAYELKINNYHKEFKKENMGLFKKNTIQNDGMIHSKIYEDFPAFVSAE